jgi:hypothetical protein
MSAVSVACVSLMFLAGCGADDFPVARDPATTGPSAATTGSSPEPTAEPTVGTYPPFRPESYRFRLVVSCYCPGTGVPIKVTVEDDEVVRAVYLAADEGRGVDEKGDPADKLYWLTIDDIIKAANDTRAARVTVEWPPGQDYPSSVYVDKDLDMADEEIGYEVSAVRVR